MGLFEGKVFRMATNLVFCSELFIYTTPFPFFFQNTSSLMYLEGQPVQCQKRKQKKYTCNDKGLDTVGYSVHNIRKESLRPARVF